MGYVKDRPLVHSSHWRGKLSSYFSSLRNADHLRKQVAMLRKATTIALSPEEAVCALADTAGNIGEVVEKLKSLEFHCELKLVCRSLHVRSMICMVDGGFKIFKDTDVDTFGDHGEFDDLSMFSDQLMRKKNNLLGSEVGYTLQHIRSIPTNMHKISKVKERLFKHHSPASELNDPSTKSENEGACPHSTNHISYYDSDSHCDAGDERSGDMAGTVASFIIVIERVSVTL